MELFVRVVESGSFTAAASALRMSRTRATTEMQRLEDHLGLRLLPGWGPEPLPTHVLCPATRVLPARVRVWVDWLRPGRSVHCSTEPPGSLGEGCAGG